MSPFQEMWVQVDSTWCCVFPNQGARCSPVRAHIFVGRADCHINVTNSSPQGYNYTSCSHCYTFSPHCNKPSTCRWLFYHLPALHVEPFAGPDLQVHDSLTHDNSFFFSFFFFYLDQKRPSRAPLWNASHKLLMVVCTRTRRWLLNHIAPEWGHLERKLTAPERTVEQTVCRGII